MSPEILPDNIIALRALVLAAWAERDAERSEKARLIEERDQLAGQNDRLRHLIRQLQRMQFGRRSEKLDLDQFNLALEDLEQAVAASEAEQDKPNPALRQARSEKRRTGRGPLPEHLPRVEIVVEPEDTACPCCGSAMHVIGEDRSQRLDVIPAQYQVVVTRRPKYACRTCQGAVVQAPAPARLIEGGLPTEQLVAHVVVAKYADHCPLYRQAQILARQGITIDRTTLAFWTGYAAAELKPVWRLMRDELLGSTKRSGSRTHQEGLLLGAGSRRPAVVRPGAAGGGVQLCPGARWRPRRGAAEGLFGRAANRRLFRLSQPRQSQARRWPGDARLLPSRRGCCHPRPSQTRTSGFPASGSSRASFAHGPAYWWTIKAGGSGYRPSMARKRIHGRWLWRPRRASHFFQIRRSWWWYQRTRRPFPVMP